MPPTTQFRTCPLCEATCGLEITVEDGHVTSVRGDRDDVFSRGFICPKATAVKHLHEDPDRVRAPLLRSGTDWRTATWEEAFAAVEKGLQGVLDEHGHDSVGLYVGNPSVHSLSATVMLAPFVKALGSKNFYSAATVDQMPKHVSAGLMFGRPEMIPVPDIDRTDYLLVLGANPWVSNGSLATAPDFRGRLQAISARGGRVVVVDPRRTETAAGADEHIFIRPGADAFLLLAMGHVLFSESLIDRASIADYISGVDEVAAVVEGFSPDSVEDVTGIEARTIRRLAHELAGAPRAAVYDRAGVHQHEFGTFTSWASDVLTTLTGNLDREGGKLFSLAAHARPDPDTPAHKGWRPGRFTSRVKGYAEAFGQLPAATMADEIETEGPGRIRAFISFAGNPVLSTPNGSRLSNALESIDFMVSVDPYLNETSRHAHVILPPPSALSRSHYDFAFYGLSVRNIANYSPPLMAAEGPDEWEILSRLTLVVTGQSAAGDPHFVPTMALNYLMQKAAAPGGSLEGRDLEEITDALGPRGPLEKILDFRLRLGPYGDRFGEVPDGLTLAKLEANPHGIDLGPLRSRLPNALQTATGRVELAPAWIVDDIPRLKAGLENPRPEMVLIGRRQLRSNNSWMHNVPAMMRGSNRCTLLINPEDAARRGLADGASARLRSRAGQIDVVVEPSDEMMPGVVSLPHGWGHGAPDIRMSVASAHPGSSVNDVTDELIVDPLSGNAVLNAVPVELDAIVDVTEAPSTAPLAAGGSES